MKRKISLGAFILACAGALAFGAWHHYHPAKPKSVWVGPMPPQAAIMASGVHLDSCQAEEGDKIVTWKPRGDTCYSADMHGPTSYAIRKTP